MKTIILALLFSTLTSACTADDSAEVERYSCLIRFQCVGTDDILAREYWTCAGSLDEAEDNTMAAGQPVALERCGEGQLSWTRATCDSLPVAEAAYQCEGR